MNKPRVFTRSINNGTMRQVKYTQKVDGGSFSYSINLYPQNPDYELGGKYTFPMGYKPTVAGEPENETTPSGYYVNHIGHTCPMCDFKSGKEFDFSKNDLRTEAIDKKLRWQDFRVQEICTMKHDSRQMSDQRKYQSIIDCISPTDAGGMYDYSEVLDSVTFLQNTDYTDIDILQFTHSLPAFLLQHIKQFVQENLKEWKKYCKSHKDEISEYNVEFDFDPIYQNTQIIDSPDFIQYLWAVVYYPQYIESFEYDDENNPHHYTRIDYILDDIQRGELTIVDEMKPLLCPTDSEIIKYLKDNIPDYLSPENSYLDNYSLYGIANRYNHLATTGYNFLFNKFAQQYNPNPNGIYDVFYPISELSNDSYYIEDYSQITYEQLIIAYKSVQGVWGEALRICLEELMENYGNARGVFRKDESGELRNIIVQPSVFITFRSGVRAVSYNITNKSLCQWYSDNPCINPETTDYIGFNPYEFPYTLIEKIQKKTSSIQYQLRRVNQFTAGYIMRLAAHEMIHCFFGLDLQHGAEFSAYYEELLTYTSLRTEELMKYVESNNLSEQIHFIQTYLKPKDYEHVLSYSEAWVRNEFEGKSTEEIFEWCKEHNLWYVSALDNKEIHERIDGYNFHDNREDLYRFIAAALA